MDKLQSHGGIATSPIVVDLLLRPQLELSVTTIIVISCLLVGIWSALWYLPPYHMRSKHSQTYYELIGYVTLWCLGATAMYQQNLLDIFMHIDDVWAFPPITSRLCALYFEAEISWYIAALIQTVLSRNGRASKDFFPMLLHHMITPVEIYYSYHCRYAAIGTVIMILHDTSDVMLHLAKTFHNLKLTLYKNVLFVVFAVVFAVTRLVLLPMCPYAYFNGANTPQSTCGHALSYTCCALVLLHCYWFIFICQMIVNALRKGSVAGDIRDSDNDDEQDERQQVHPTALTTAIHKLHSNGNNTNGLTNGHRKAE